MNDFKCYHGMLAARRIVQDAAKISYGCAYYCCPMKDNASRCIFWKWEREDMEQRYLDMKRIEQEKKNKIFEESYDKWQNKQPAQRILPLDKGIPVAVFKKGRKEMMPNHPLYGDDYGASKAFGSSNGQNGNYSQE